jgi:hypothetical protein
VTVEEHVVQEPQWLKTLVDRVVEAIEPLNLMGPFGYRWLEPNTEANPSPAWVIAVYPTPNEAYGGQHDGQLLYPGFNLDLAYIVEGFSQVGALAWNNPTVYNGDLDGPHISIQGYFAGYPAWVRIFHLPPRDEEPTLVVDLASGDWWEKTAGQQ